MTSSIEKHINARVEQGFQNGSENLLKLRPDLTSKTRISGSLLNGIVKVIRDM